MSLDLTTPALDQPADAAPLAEIVTHAGLESLAQTYAQAAQRRRELQQQLRSALLATAAGLVNAIRAAAAAERDGQEALLAAVTAAPGLFVRPRTRSIHGVKYGWQTGKASIDIPDEAKTIRLIRAKLPAEQAELLIRITERVEKRAVLDLSAQDLRRLAIVQVPGQDAPLVSLPKDGIDRLVDTLLAETAQAAGEVA